MTPALVLGSDGITVLGVIRTLGCAGIPTYVATAPARTVRYSRWYRRPPGVSEGLIAELTADGDLARFLERLPFEQAVLVPCSDVWALSAAQLASPLAARFRTISGPASAVAILGDKGRFAEVLRSAGLPHPRTVLLPAGADLTAIPDDAFAGAFLKPRDSYRFFQRFGVKARRIASRAAAAELLGPIGAAGLEMILQEYVSGPASNHYFVDGFVDQNGILAAAFCRRRLRMHPPDFGNSSYMVSVGRDQVAAAVTTMQRILESVGYRGVFSAEFKYDERDGLFKVLEVNARPWWYVEFAARCGVDVCGMAYRDALGLKAEPVGEYRVGSSCVFPLYDYGACLQQYREGRLSAGAWARSWLTAQQPVFRWSDPLPAVIETTMGLGRHLRKILLPSSHG